MKPSPMAVQVNITGIDEAIEKMNQLNKLLAEANQIIGSIKEIELSIKANSES